MNTHVMIELPAEFRSGNDILVTVATIKRERMEEILRDAIEADRKQATKQLSAAKQVIKSLQTRLTLVTKELDDLKKNTNPELLASEREANAILTDELERLQRGGAVAWPKNAQEIRDFIGTNFISRVGDDTPSDDDKYLVTAHDLLSAFLWWTDFAPQPAEPSSGHTGTVKCPDPSMGAHACNDKSQCWEPCGELGKSSEHAKVAEPAKVHSDAGLYALIQEWFAPSYIPGENLYVLRFARALLARYGNATPTQENES